MATIQQMHEDLDTVEADFNAGIESDTSRAMAAHHCRSLQYAVENALWQSHAKQRARELAQRASDLAARIEEKVPLCLAS